MWRSVRCIIGSYTLKIFAFALILLFSLTLTAPSLINADTEGMMLIFHDVGYFDFVAHGTGTRGNPENNDGIGQGSFALEIEREMIQVKEAHLIWTGRVEDNDQPNIYDTDGVMLSINGSPLVNIEADLQLKQDPWFSVGSNDVIQVHESANITALVQDVIPAGGTYSGNIDFLVTDHEHGVSSKGTNPDYALNYGVGVWIIYEYVGAPDEKLSEVFMYEGQDSFFRLWTPPRGPHSQVQCFNFPATDEARPVDMTHLVSGVDLEADDGRKRSNAFWYMTGTGAAPVFDSPEPGIINVPGAIGYVPTGDNYPLHSSAGLEWDNFEPEGFVVVPADHTWLCLQIESGDSADLAGLNNDHLPASGMWNFFGVRLASDEPPPPTAVTLTSFTAVGNGLQVELAWETSEEINNFGYNLYRSATSSFGDATLIHFEPTKLSGGNGPGASYHYVDNAPSYGDWTYWLEDVETGGTKTVHDPVSVTLTQIFRQYLPFIFN